MKRPFILFSIVALFMLTVTTVFADETYTVQKGDNLYQIAKKYSLPLEAIQKANNLTTTSLKIGMQLSIPTDSATGLNASSEEVTPSVVRIGTKTKTAGGHNRTYFHTVKKGETLASLSRHYGTSVAELKELNNLKKNSRIKVGQQIQIRKSGPKVYAVKKGDTVLKIAKKFSVSVADLKEFNELDSDTLKPGQKLFLEEYYEQDISQNPVVRSDVRIEDEIRALSASQDLASLTMRERLVLFAQKMMNIPYRFGGSTFLGIDCSAFVQRAFACLNIALPRTAREQFSFGDPINKEELSIGDLVFFRTYASFPSHVGIYLGNDLFIHASARSKKVSIDSLDTPYYVKRYIGAKRLFTEEYALLTE